MNTRIVIAIATIVSLLAGPAAASAAMIPSGTRQAAPDFMLKDLNGKPHKLSDYRGKVVLLNFWATWCPPCRAEIPSMESMYRALKNRNFVIIGVEVGEDVASVWPFVEEQKITYPILLDRDSAVSNTWKAVGIPTSFLIDPQGRVADMFVGGRDWSDPALRARITSLLPKRRAPHPAAVRHETVSVKH